MELLTVYAIVNAVTANLPGVQRVQILVDGREVDTIAGHIDVRRPLERDRVAGAREVKAARWLAFAIQWKRYASRRPTRGATPPHPYHPELSDSCRRFRARSSRARRRSSARPASRTGSRRSGGTAAKGWVTAEYGMLPRATTTRTQREASVGPRRRAHAGDPAAHRPLAARGHPHGGARRAHDHARLRRHPGRRRHAHGVDHAARSSRSSSRCRNCASRMRSARCRCPTSSPPPASGSWTASRCSTSPMSKTPGPTWT